MPVVFNSEFFVAFFSNEPQMDAGEVLREVLLQAKAEGRITAGVYRSANKLDM